MGRKWNNIKEKKASKDANTSKVYAKFGVEIYVAAKKGGAFLLEPITGLIIRPSCCYSKD